MPCLKLRCLVSTQNLHNGHASFWVFFVLRYRSLSEYLSYFCYSASKVALLNIGKWIKPVINYNIDLTKQTQSNRVHMLWDMLWTKIREETCCITMVSNINVDNILMSSFHEYTWVVIEIYTIQLIKFYLIYFALFIFAFPEVCFIGVAVPMM